MQKLHQKCISFSHFQVSPPNICPYPLLTSWIISWQIWQSDRCLSKWGHGKLVLCFLFILQISSPNIPACLRPLYFDKCLMPEKVVILGWWGLPAHLVYHYPSQIGEDALVYPPLYSIGRRVTTADYGPGSPGGTFCVSGFLEAPANRFNSPEQRCPMKVYFRAHMWATNLIFQFLVAY